MSVLTKLADSIVKGEAAVKGRKNCTFDKVFQSKKENCKNILASGDSRDFMTYLKENGYQGKFKAVYIDPPFFSKAKYNSSFALEDENGHSHRIKMEAYDDHWNNSIDSYIEYIASMVYGIHELLAEDGVIMLHIDWHASHYCRLILDEVFGEKNFINEIIWTYKSGGAGSKSFAKKHDNILIYGKTGNYTYNQSKVKSYNRDFKKYCFKGIEEFEDEKGWYTLVHERDVWFMDMVGRTSKERTGYATQKPKALLEKLIRAFTNEGDLVGDFCAGSGTTAKVCHKENRNWICADINNGAITMIMREMCHEGANFNLLTDSRENFMLSGSILSFDKGLFSSNLSYDNNYYDNFNKKEIKDAEIGEISSLKEKMSSQSFEKVQSIGTKNPESLINFVSFDFDYDGKVHKSDQMFGRRKEYDSFLNEGLWNKANGRKKVHVFYGDVFGGFSEKEEFEDE